MSKTATIVLAILGFVALVTIWCFGNYNSMVTAKAAVTKAFATIEVQYQRRFDLIGNLVESAKGGQKQEQAVFIAIADARRQYSNATSTNAKAEAVNRIETNVVALQRLQEAYPELKSNELVQKLMNQLEGTEGSIASARDNYNTVATNYNVGITRFPKNIFAKIFDFKEAVLFHSTQGAENAVKVQF